MPRDLAMMMKRIKLTILEGVHAGKQFTACSGQTPVVGRSPSADFAIADLRLSRSHFVLVDNGKEWFVSDLQSKNGTQLNNRMIEYAPVRRDDVIVAGDTRFRVSL